MTQPTAQEIKRLFSDLVIAAGGVESAGARLGISHQRISQLRSVTSQDLPTILQVVTLEVAIGQPIVTKALARAATGDPTIETPLHDELCEVSITTADVLRSEITRDPKAFTAAVVRLKREAAELPVRLAVAS